jgi:predicted ATPase
MRYALRGYPRLQAGGSFAPRASFPWRAISMWRDGRGIPPDFLSHSHGEGFLRFFEERCNRQGIFIFDEPESALSPSRQIAFLKLLRRMESSGNIQVLMATHSPMLMAYPTAQLLRLSHHGLDPIAMMETDHYRLMREFCADPSAFIDNVLAD